MWGTTGEEVELLWPSNSEQRLWIANMHRQQMTSVVTIIKTFFSLAATALTHCKLRKEERKYAMPILLGNQR
jgi:hypothetical protein